MGYMNALAFSGEVQEGNVSLENALRWHLGSNHYPPVPASMVPVCVRAIAKAKRGLWDAKVRLPEGCTYRGKSLASVSAVIRGHHLEAFLEG